MQSFVALGLVTVLWALVGYTLAFGPDKGRLIGGLDFAGLAGVGAKPSVFAPTVPATAYMMFQLMFAIITPALIAGAFAERMRFSGYLVVIGLWSLVVYAPVAHWVWGRGFLGAGILWFGWFGFNAGSAFSAGDLASNAFVNTQLGAAAAMLAWMIAERLPVGRATTVGAATGAVAGLATITPASGYVEPWGALLIGAAAGFVCFAAELARGRLDYDDSLYVVGVHMVGGMVGVVLTGALASLAINAAGASVSLEQVGRRPCWPSSRWPTRSW